MNVCGRRGGSTLVDTGLNWQGRLSCCGSRTRNDKWDAVCLCKFTSLCIWFGSQLVGSKKGSKQHCRDMPLIIKNKRIASREAEVVSESVERCLCEAAHIPKNLPAAVEIDDDTAAGSSQRKVSTTRIADVLRPEIRRLTAQPDNSVERIRKYIPAELLVAWAMIKVGFDSAFEGPADTSMEITTFTCVWAGFVAVVFLYVFASLRHERYIVPWDDELSFTDLVSHSLVSSIAFVLYSMTLGPPFNLWGVPEWLPFVGMACFTLLVTIIGDPYIAPIVSAHPQRQQMYIGSHSVSDPLMGGSHPVSDRGDEEDLDDFE